MGLRRWPRHCNKRKGERRNELQQLKPGSKVLNYIHENCHVESAGAERSSRIVSPWGDISG